MDQEYHKIRPIIDVFDKMREILRNEDIDMPKIVVVGDQSSGKSSVLESITGLQLPRGQNTVTRCPTVIQLKRAANKSSESATLWIEREENTKTVSLSELSEAISEKQKILIEREHVEITKTSINIRVSKENAPDLTLYDLPGITYKNDNLITTIREIIKKYTAGLNTIILMILPANCDLTTSEALSIIKSQKEYRSRTIAVITKIDLAEKGILRKIVENELELKYDPIVVRNRTQEEIDNKTEWNEIRIKEKDLINNHDELKQLSEECKGTHYLIGRLINLQKGILFEASITIKEELTKKLLYYENEYSKLPKPVNTHSEKLDLFKSCLRKFVDWIKNSMDNNISLEKEKEYNIPARLREYFDAFNSTFTKTRETFFSKEFCEKIDFMIKESRGLLLQNFINPKVFEKLIIAEIRTGIEKNSKLIDKVQIYILKILHDYCSQSFNNYPYLEKNISNDLIRVMAKQRKKVEEIISELRECECSAPFTSSGEYSEMYNSLLKETVRYREVSINYQPIYQKFTPFLTKSAFLKKEKGDDFTECCLNLQIACLSYWSVFETRFLDYLELIILKKMVFFFHENLEDYLDKTFSPSSNKLSQEAIKEDSGITSKRKTIERSIKNFREAIEEFENLERY